ncbi:hypothetical protein [Dyadobacter sediminis]|uniref:O-antigen polysaccharide polymerase Wzy n=1 Tax=Dyadobacter sediminis TaxID=1493691 RepID=A0A5R9KDZ9_9BACT|nr:hypothetical protein [Dyadobacter sediminis]TLU94287.1 hypothetical protein FEM55_08525 [Dyadobacter sediminis]GGB92589.1 hypothetical protein GCM10011325_20030 [Dyadobacter sediminis]
MMKANFDTDINEIEYQSDADENYYDKNQESFLFIFKKWALKILLGLCILEIVFFPELTVAFGIVYSLFSWMLIDKFVLKKNIILKHPLTSIIIIGYGLCSFYFPIPATLSEGKSIIFNLDIPNTVFLQGMLSLTVVVISFLVYIRIQNTITSKSLIRKILNKSGFYAAPTDFQIWAMGIIGLVSLFYIYYTGTNTSENATSFSKLLQGFFPFAYCPYFLFFKNLYSRSSPKKSSITIFLAYSAIILLLAFMTNHRATFMKVIMGLGFTYLLGLFLQRFSFQLFTPKKIFIGLVLFYLLTGPLVDLGLAMVAARAYKNSTSSLGLVTKTIDIYLDDKALEKTRKRWEGIVITNKRWDEHYVDNIFLGRLSNLKAADLSLYHSERIQNTSKMRNFLYNQITSLLPSPVLNLLDIEVDKVSINKASYGDYLYYLSTGDSYGLQSKRQAQINGAGMAAFDYWYLLILFIVMIPLFWLIDLLTFSIDSMTYITVPALTIMPMIMTLFNFEGLSTFISFILRGWIQLVLIYMVLIKITNVMKRFV